MADLKEYITQKEKEGHLKTKTKFKKKKTTQGKTRMGYGSQEAPKVTSSGEEAAVYDVEKNKSNRYASVNRHLINKLKG